LPSETISGLEIDAQGTIWIAHTRGLSRFDPESGSIEDLNLPKELAGATFLPDIVAKDRSERIYWGTTKGLLSFSPGDLKLNSRVPPLVLTGLKVNDGIATIGERDYNSAARP